jgi:hypothetical protein
MKTPDPLHEALQKSVIRAARAFCAATELADRAEQDEMEARLCMAVKQLDEFEDGTTDDE